MVFGLYTIWAKWDDDDDVGPNVRCSYGDNILENGEDAQM